VGAEPWNAYHDGYVRAYEWARALAGGAPLPVEPATVPLEPGEIAHAHVSPVTFAGYFAAGTSYQPSFFVFGGPVGLAVTASMQYGRDAAWRAQAQRDGAPRWHRLGVADVVVTSTRLYLAGDGKAGSIPYPEMGPVQLVAGLEGGAAVQFQRPGEPPLQLASP